VLSNSPSGAKRNAHVHRLDRLAKASALEVVGATRGRCRSTTSASPTNFAETDNQRLTVLHVLSSIRCAPAWFPAR